MKEKKYRRRICLLVIFIIGYSVYSRFYSNPVTWYLSRQTAIKFTEENYPEYEYVKIRNNFLGAGDYMLAEVAVPGSKDLYFYVLTDFKGNYLEDTYQRDVLNGLNTERRLQQLYNEKIQRLLRKEKGIENIYGTLVSISKEQLVADKEYTVAEIAELSKEYGYLSVYLDSENIDNTVCAQTVLKLIEIMKENNLYFWNICVYVNDASGKLVSNTGGIEYYLISEDTVTALISNNVLRNNQ